MSEQAGGILEIKPSFQFNRDQTSGYRAHHITPDNFHSWQKDHMYKSSYNQYHSYVTFILPRILISLKMQSYLDIKAFYQVLDLKVFMVKELPQHQKCLLIPKN